MGAFKLSQLHFVQWEQDNNLEFKLELSLRLTISNYILLSDSETTFRPIMQSSSRRVYSKDGVYYDERIRQFFNLVTIPEKVEEPEVNSGDCSLDSGTSGSPRSGYSSCSYNTCSASGSGDKFGAL